MPTDEPDLDRIDQEIRINELRHQAEELAGGDMTGWESDDCPPNIAEQFWQNVVAFESAPLTSSFEQLTRSGVELPAPDDLDDAAVAAKLAEMVARLAARHTYLSNTNHLSDRELYERLWGEVLHEAGPDLPPGSGFHHHIDMVGSGSEEDIELYMRYYADEETRRRWAADFPTDILPDHEDPPYDRDRHLPRAQY